MSSVPPTKKIKINPAAASSCRTTSSSNASSSSASSSKADVMPKLECPVCLQVSLPPIFNCVEGHSVCGDCREKIKTCPICIEKYPKKPSRNYSLENIVEGTTLRCDFPRCQLEVMGGQLKAHRRECQFRPIKCGQLGSFKGCGQMMEFCDCAKHLGKSLWSADDCKRKRPLTSHDFQFSSSTEPTFVWRWKRDVTTNMYHSTGLPSFSHQFVVSCFQKEPLYQWVVGIFAGPTEAVKWRATIRIRKPYSIDTIAVTIPVISVHNLMGVEARQVPKTVGSIYFDQFNALCSPEAAGQASKFWFQCIIQKK